MSRIDEHDLVSGVAIGRVMPRAQKTLAFT